jgi:hypothetical protein
VAKKPKKYALPADQIKPLAVNQGGCIASDMITVDGLKVGYMYRQTMTSIAAGDSCPVRSPALT